MKLASLQNGTRDGKLVLISRDLSRYVDCADVALTMQEALDNWADVSPRLAVIADRLEREKSGLPFNPTEALAPLPRAWQWLDGSAFATHGELMQQAYDLPPIPTDKPLMYQGLSHHFAPGHADMRFPSEEDGIDFEAEFAVIVDDVPLGVSPDQAMEHIKLILLLNDWSLRVLGAAEMRTGFGWVQAKPPCSAAPVAVTPDELDGAWQNGRVHLPVTVRLQGVLFGAAQGGVMDFGFHDLIAHAARTRSLCAGTIIGSGTVSNADCRAVGSSCIAERRAIEKIDLGAPRTAFMQFGDHVEIEVFASERSVFGKIKQDVAQSSLTHGLS